MRLRDCNYYGLAHDAVAKKFGGGLTYVGTFNVNEEYLPSAVYHAATPNLAKGHKDYFLLVVRNSGDGVIRGMTKEQLQPFALRSAIHCLDCDDVIYSCMRHHSTRCKCGNAMTDGGSDQIHNMAVSRLDRVTFGTVNALTKTYEVQRDGKTQPTDTEGVKSHGTRKGKAKASQVQPVQAKPKRKRKAPPKARRKKAA